MNPLKNIWRKIVLFFTFSRSPVIKKRAPRKHKENTVASFGQFTTIKSVLETLDELFADIKKLEPKEKEFQILARKYGPYVCSMAKSDDVGDAMLANKLGSGFKAYGLPTFLINYRNKNWYRARMDDPVSQFFVARKTTSLPFLKPKGNIDCYECCFVGMLEGEKWPLEIHFNIVIHEGGEVEAYPYLANIPRRTKKGRIVSRKMGLYYPDYTPEEDAASIEARKEYLVESFCLEYNIVMTRENAINIIVKKGKARATITVPPNRWKYFFKYREKVKTPSGRTKPIFHAVTSHHRHYKDGRISPVKTHYRGTRNFHWGKYSVKIVLPGKHAPSQSTFGLPGEIVDEETMASGKWRDLGSNKASEKLNKIFEGE